MKKAYPVANALNKLSLHFIRKSFTSSSKRCAEPENLQYYARKKQTNVSLKALMETGNGKYLDEVKTGMSPAILDEASANEKILIQVSVPMMRCPYCINRIGYHDWENISKSDKAGRFFCRIVVFYENSEK